MKKIIIKFSTFILLLCIFAACSKEEKVSPVNDDNNINSQPINKNFNETDIKVFIANADAYDENTDKGGNERFNFGDAIWYLEASINYSFGDANGEQGNIHRDTVIVTIPIATDSSMSYGNVMSTFKHLRNEARKSIRKNPDSRMLIYDITKVEASMVNQTARIITVNYIIGKDDNIIVVPSIQVPVYNDDYWMWGMELGKCDGTRQPWDAAKIIAQRCNTYNNTTYPTTAQRVYYTNPYSIPTSEMDNTSGRVYELWCQGCTLPCLNPIEMQQYTVGLLYLGNYHKLVSLDIANYILAGDAYFGIPWTGYMHYGSINYGVRNFTYTPPID